MAKVWMRACEIIYCLWIKECPWCTDQVDSAGSLSRLRVTGPWSALTELCGFEDGSKFTEVCQSRRCLTHSVRRHWHVLYDPPESNVLKILQIASKEILLSDGKTDVLMTCVALSPKNRDKWPYLPKLKKKWGVFVSFCVVSFFWGCFFWIFGLVWFWFFSLICLRFLFGFWSGVFCLLI